MPCIFLSRSWIELLNLFTITALAYAAYHAAMQKLNYLPVSASLKTTMHKKMQCNCYEENGRTRNLFIYQLAQT